MAHCPDAGSRPVEPSNEPYIQESISGAVTSSAPLFIVGTENDPDTERNAGLDGLTSSAPQSSWRHLASLSFSALSGDTIWHRARADRNR